MALSSSFPVRLRPARPLVDQRPRSPGRRPARSRCWRRPCRCRAPSPRRPDRPRRRRSRVVARAAGHGVRAGAAVEHVAAGAAAQRVVAQPAAQRVAVVAADQGVVRRAAEHDLDAAQRVVAVTARGAGREVDGDRRGERAVVCGVAAGAAAQAVVAGAADQRVVAGAAIQRIVAVAAFQAVAAGAAGDLVVARAAEHDLDADQRVAALAAGNAGREVDRQRGRGAAIVGRVDAVAAVQDVVAAIAFQAIVAGAAAQRVVPRAAAQDVAALVSDDEIVGFVSGAGNSAASQGQVLDRLRQGIRRPRRPRCRCCPGSTREASAAHRPRGATAGPPGSCRPSARRSARSRRRRRRGCPCRESPSTSAMPSGRAPAPRGPQGAGLLHRAVGGDQPQLAGDAVGDHGIGPAVAVEVGGALQHPARRQDEVGDAAHGVGPQDVERRLAGDASMRMSTTCTWSGEPCRRECPRSRRR